MANDINDGGVIVGTLTQYSGYNNAAIWYRGQLTRLITGGAYSNSEAAAVSASGHVVGSMNTSGRGSMHAFLYDSNQAIDLGTHDINDKGQILATGFLAGGTCASVVLSLADGEQFYVPGPEAFTAGLAGLALFGWMRRRKQA